MIAIVYNIFSWCVCIRRELLSSDAGILISMGQKDASPYFSAIAEKYGRGEEEEKKEVEKRTIKKEKKEEG